VRYGSDRLARGATGGDRGDDGAGKKRVRDNSNANSGGGYSFSRGRGRRGGRGTGRGVGRGGGRDGDRGDARLITASMSRATCPQDILSIVRDHHRELDHIHVSTAFNKLGKVAKSRDLSRRRLSADEDFQKLLGIARSLAEESKLGSQAVANATHGIAKLHEAGRLESRLDATDESMDATLVALEGEAVRVAPDMKPQEMANTLYAYGVMDRMPGEGTWAALETAAVRVAPDLKPQEVANTLYAYGVKGRMPEEGAWAALEIAVVRVTPDMKPQEVANTLYAYGVMGRMPGERTWAALDTAALRVARNMNSLDVAHTLWCYATMKSMPGDKTWAALEFAAMRVARDMNSQKVALTLWSYATQKSMPGDKTWLALEFAAMRVARDMKQQNVADTLWSYATLGRMPRDKMWAVLETAAVRVAPDMKPQNVALTLWSYATLKRMPGDKTWAALEFAAVRVARDMKPQNVANTVFAYATLSILQNVAHPSCYAALWELVNGLEARDFSDESLRMLFHAYLMHHSASRSVTVTYPAWLMVEARGAWMRNVEDDVTVSRGRRSLARVFDELGVRHEVERRTGDGYFSMDIYLPDYDVAVQFNGPTHYYHTSESSSTSRDASTTTRTAKTELRDFFLATQCAKVVTVPWFELTELEGSPENWRLYVKEKLAKEAGVEV
jgi:hypothetical protein